MSRADKIANLGIMIIAVSALLVSLWLMQATEKHNRLTVKPLMDFLVINDDSSRTITSKNAGIGPAIITEMCYKYESEDCLFMDQALQYANVAEDVLGMFNDGP